jgi:hypothetical protein
MKTSSFNPEPTATVKSAWLSDFHCRHCVGLNDFPTRLGETHHFKPLVEAKTRIKEDRGIKKGPMNLKDKSYPFFPLTPDKQIAGSHSNAIFPYQLQKV